jgi:hypothetical protein
MNTWPLISAILGMVILSGCASTEASGELPRRDLAKGAFSGIQDSQQHVIRTEAAWQKLWKQHAATRQPPPEPPTVNFDREMVIAAFMGLRRTGGFAVEIARVESAQKNLQITVVESSPPEGGMSLQALTAPFHIVAVPKSKLPEKFSTESRVRSR